MKKSDISDKKKALKDKAGKSKAVLSKWTDIWKWKLQYVNQAWFFSLDEVFQSFVETTYMVVLQSCPDLEWDEFLDRMRVAHTCNTWIKNIVRNIPRK